MSTCLLPGAVPITLPPDASLLPYCAPGFFCPFLARATPGNLSTYPSLCAPTPACGLQRLSGAFCAPQGATEPVPCAPGFYCPTPLEQLACPAGSFCPRGSTAPRACQFLSACPEGTRVGRFWGGLLLCGVLDAVLVALYLWYKYRREPAVNRVASAAGRREVVRAARSLRYASETSSLNPLRVAVEGATKGSASGEQSPLANENGFGLSVPSVPPVLDWELAEPRNDTGKSGSASPAARSSYFSAFADNLRARVATLPPGVVRSGTGKLRTKSFYGAGALSAGVADDGAESSTDVDLAVAASAAALLQDAFRRCNEGQALTLDFSGLSLTLPPPLNKQILADVSGRIAPGRVTAVMGPSGAGKTTFLNVLMGRLKRSAGGLLINGAPDEMSRFGRITGFVPQEDVMLTEMTVRESIAHSARVRLPRAWPAADVELLVEAVIEVLGLRSCADTPAARISGGQRKRTNIGIELVTAPSALFLDEPTSGLDATAALQVCSTLRSVADLGLTVVAVIHQPRVEIFRSVSDLLLLAPGGVTVFQGPQVAVLDYFVRAGLAFTPDGNPADDLLDFVAGRHPILAPQAEVERVAAGAHASSVLANALRRLPGGRASPVNLRGAEVPAYLAALWRADGASVAGSGAGGSCGGDGGGDTPPPTINESLRARERAALTAVMADRGASFAAQLVLCHNRYTVQQYRTPSWLALELGVCVLAGSIMGLAATAVDELYAGVLVPPYTALSPAPIESLLPSLGLYQCMAIGVAGAPAAVRIFGEEREVFLRENAAHHSAGAYFLAKNLAVLWRMALAALHFSAFFTFLARPTSAFATMFGLSIGTLFGVVGLAEIVSMVVARANAALLGTILALIVACLCGFGPSLKQGREWGFLIIAQDVSYSRWAVELWLNSETDYFRGLYLVDDVTAATFGYTLQRPGVDGAMMAAIGLALRGLAYVGLLAIAQFAAKT